MAITQESGERPRVVDPFQLYAATEVRRILRQPNQWWDDATRSGLRVLWVNDEAFVLGHDLIRFLERSNRTAEVEGRK